MKKINSDTIIGIGFAILAIVFLVMTNSMAKVSGPGPDTFPKVVGGAMLVVSIALIIRSLIAGADKEFVVNKSGAKTVVALMVLIAVYVFVLPKIGFLISSIALFVPAMLLFGVREKKIVIGLSIVVPVALFLIFKVGLNVPLPGIL